MPVVIDELDNERDPNPPESHRPSNGISEHAISMREPSNAGTPRSSRRWYGVYPALVVDITDPDDQGRVRVALPWAIDAGGSSGIEQGSEYRAWARLATLAGGDNRGSFFIPEVDDEVLVSFQGGDPNRPFVIGGLWNGADRPPASVASNGTNHEKTLKTKSGNRLTLSDTPGHESVLLETPAGQRLRLHAGKQGSVTIEDGQGGVIEMTSDGIKIHSDVKVEISGPVQITSTSVEIDSGMTTFSGVVQCATLITPSVVASNYSPGSGNMG